MMPTPGIWLSLLCLAVVPLNTQNILSIPVMEPPSMPVPAPVFVPLPPLITGTPLSLTTDIPVPSAADNVRRQTELKKVDEAAQLREAWKEAFGFDVWYPYYKEKEIESWVRNKFRVRVFRFKGEPQFTSKGFTYIFKSVF